MNAPNVPVASGLGSAVTAENGSVTSTPGGTPVVPHLVAPGMARTVRRTQALEVVARARGSGAAAFRAALKPSEK